LIRIGTRGSALALAQASWVASRLGGETELVKITTAGDRGAAVGDKSRWVSALEQALLANEIDIAVHSAKDVPAELAEGLALVAIPERADARDAICGADSLASLRAGARVGTSSLRRAAQIRAIRDDLDVVSLRGNVDTRLRKLADGEVDALVLAAAGLARLGRADAAGGVLDELVPAAGQGALAVEARTPDPAAEAPARDLAAAPTLASGLAEPSFGAGLRNTLGKSAKLADQDATACVMAERELTRVLGASCNTPVGAHASVIGSTDRALAAGSTHPVPAAALELVAWVGLPDGSEWISDRLTGPAPGLGTAVAGRLLSVGAAELLTRAEREVRG
jgi:hydroxymethylbilane synthase